MRIYSSQIINNSHCSKELTMGNNYSNNGNSKGSISPEVGHLIKKFTWSRTLYSTPVLMRKLSFSDDRDAHNALGSKVNQFILGKCMCKIPK